MEGYAAKQARTKALMHIILIIMSFIMLVPFAWMILTALKTKQESISVSPFYIFPHNGTGRTSEQYGRATTSLFSTRTHCS